MIRRPLKVCQWIEGKKCDPLSNQTESIANWISAKKPFLSGKRPHLAGKIFRCQNLLLFSKILLLTARRGFLFYSRLVMKIKVAWLPFKLSLSVPNYFFLEPASILAKSDSCFPALKKLYNEISPLNLPVHLKHLQAFSFTSN